MANSRLIDNGELPNVQTDTRFASFFNNKLKQVFFYITEVCNVRCRYCYYKPLLKPVTQAQEITPSTFHALAKIFKELGASKLSFLGGEPSLYGMASDGRYNIGNLVEIAKNIGYEYVRMVTNGLFEESFLTNRKIKAIDEITFSIDGSTADIHDLERGKGTFVKTEKSIIAAVKSGYNVQLTACVNRSNIGYAKTGRLLVDEIIRWGEAIGVHSINFHPFIKMNVMRDEWTGTADISPQEWNFVYETINQQVIDGQYNVAIRLPLRFVDSDKFHKRSKYYGYCPVKLAERIIIHANGNMNVCALHNATNTTLAKFREDGNILKIEWSSCENEFSKYVFNNSMEHPCTVISHRHKEELPLCISFKPTQNEFIWNKTGIEEVW